MRQCFLALTIFSVQLSFAQNSPDRRTVEQTYYGLERQPKIDSTGVRLEVGIYSPETFKQTYKLELQDTLMGNRPWIQIITLGTTTEIFYYKGKLCYNTKEWEVYKNPRWIGDGVKTTYQELSTDIEYEYLLHEIVGGWGFVETKDSTGNSSYFHPTKKMRIEKRYNKNIIDYLVDFKIVLTD